MSLPRPSFTFQRGDISKASNIRHIPAIEGVIAINPGKVVLKDQSIPVLYEQGVIPTRASRNYALAYCLSRFYHLDGHHDINTPRLVVSAVGLFMNMADWGSLRPWPAMKNYFKELGVNLIINPVSAAGIRDICRRDERCNQFADLFGDDWDYIISDTDSLLVEALVILLIMGKNVNRDYISRWFANRVKGFAGAIGQLSIIHDMTSDKFPHADVLASYANMISSSFSIRRELFVCCVSLAKSPEVCAITIEITELIHMLKGMELNHIILIDKYLISKYRELFHVHCLRGLEKLYASARACLEKYPEDKRMYVRLLYPKSETAELNRNIFSIFSAAATACAQFENSTFENYYLTDNTAELRVASFVKGYLNKRQILLEVAAGDHDRKKMGQEETKLLFESVVKEYEKKYNFGDQSDDEDEIIIPNACI